MTTKQKTLIAAGAVAVILVGGWLYAQHRATAVARDVVDGFIIRHDLRGQVSYDALSASPFGSMSVSGVRIKLSPTTAITLSSLDISDLESKHDQLSSVSLEASGVEVPVLAMARDKASGLDLRDALGLGYTKLSGRASLALHYDDMKGSASIESAGEMKDAGSWKAKISLAGIDPNSVNALSGMADGHAQANGLARLLAAGQGLASLMLVEADVSLDNAGIHKREVTLTDQDLPPDGSAGPAPIAGLDETQLVRDGMAPSDAAATHAALQTWMNKGGQIKIATTLSQPLPLFRNGNLFAPSFDGLAGFLAATKSRISD
jgi:hypothetical protein